MNIPANLKYTQDDEWVRIEGEFAFVGITDYAQHELGDIDKLDMGFVFQFGFVEHKFRLSSAQALLVVSVIRFWISRT